MAPDIPELGKARDTACSKLNVDLRKPGCSAYEDRPEVCRSFACGWLSGLGETRDRPDRSGVLWQPLEMPDGRPGLGLVELRPRALDEQRNADWLRRFEATKPGRIVVRRYRKARFELAEVRVKGRAIGEIDVKAASDAVSKVSRAG